MNAAALLSGQLLQAFEEEQACLAAQADIKREPMSGRLHHEQPFGGGEPSEMIFETLESEQENSIASNSGFHRRGMSRAMSQGGNGAGAWATHPSVASRASTAAFGVDQGDIKPLLGWYGEEAGEESMRQLATMQAKLNQRLGPEYVSSRVGPGGGPKLHYLEGWKAIDLANDVFGFNGWSTNLVRLDTDFIENNHDGSRCNVGVSAIMRVTLRDGTFHEDIGYGHIENAKGKAAALEKAKKEAVTDALKRSLRTFGRLVGNCMYDKKYLETVSKMRPDAQKYDVTQLHRRTDSNAPPPPPVVKEEHEDGPETRAGFLAAGAEKLPRSVSNASPRKSNGDERPSQAEQERMRAERQALASERQAAFRQRQEEQRQLAAQMNPPPKPQESRSPQNDSSNGGPGAVSVSRPPPQLRRAPLAPVPISPPKAIPDSAAGRVYGKEPGAKWARGSVPPPKEPQVRPDTAQTMEGIGDSTLSPAVDTLEASKGQGSRLAPHVAPQPRRAPSGGRFVTPNDGASEQMQVDANIGGVTSLSAAGSTRGRSPVNNAAGGAKRLGQGAAEPREPLTVLEVDDGGSVKRQKR